MSLSPGESDLLKSQIQFKHPKCFAPGARQIQGLRNIAEHTRPKCNAKK
jgi:hypothetical protein